MKAYNICILKDIYTQLLKYIQDIDIEYLNKFVNYEIMQRA